jgi:uncharacterized protein YndB with AHSA1/START domain
MKEYVSTATIEASAEEVWAVLTDGGAYAEWNPEITGIDGRLALGETVRAQVRLGSGVVRVVPQRVVVFNPPDRMEWIGGLPMRLFVGRRIYTVTPRATGAEFSLRVQMSGLLAPLILKSVGDRQPELDSFTKALKARVEQRAR